MANDSFDLTGSTKPPEKREDRIKAIMKFTRRQKASMLPPGGLKFQIGPYVYKIIATNIDQLKFSGVLFDVIIDGCNDGKTGIIDPYTHKR